MIRTKGEAGTGNIVEAVRHIRAVMEGIQQVVSASEAELDELAKLYRVPVDLVKDVKKLGKLPVVNFAAGGVATPADAALMMHLGCDGVFVGSGIFKSKNPSERAKAIVEATTHYDEPNIVAEVSKGLGDPMRGIDATSIPEEKRLQGRGW